MSKCVFDKGKVCSALTEKDCKGCSFAKTKEELEDGREHATELFYRVPRKQRDAIRKKYYGERSGHDGVQFRLSVPE